MISQVHPGTATAIGSLPFTDPVLAATTALALQPALPAIPSLPNRSPMEAMIAQAAIGLPGVSVGPDGSLILDVRRLDPDAEPVTDLCGPGFVTLQAFLTAAAGRTRPVKWQLTGPVTLGMALERAGAPAEVAFDLALRAVRSRARALHRAIATALPKAEQLVFFDEPSFTAALLDSSPIAPDVAVDLLSSALATLGPGTCAGVHCCAEGDVAALVSAGPSVLSLPVHRGLTASAGYLAGFLEGGGWIAWGAIPTNQPLGSTVDPWWRELAGVWCDLVGAGCDPVMLRRQSLITPACGLAGHRVEQAEFVLELTNQVAVRVGEQAVATRLNVGA
jgi:hypothetical protein